MRIPQIFERERLRLPRQSMMYKQFNLLADEMRVALLGPLHEPLCDKLPGEYEYGTLVDPESRDVFRFMSFLDQKHSDRNKRMMARNSISQLGALVWSPISIILKESTCVTPIMGVRKGWKIIVANEVAAPLREYDDVWTNFATAEDLKMLSKTNPA